MANKKNLKAQDLFNQSTPFLGKTSSFHEAFPEIKKVVVEFTEIGDIPQWRYGGPKTKNGYDDCVTDSIGIAEYINCSNPKCYGGGFRLGNELRNMIYLKQNVSEGSVSCIGQEGTPKGRKIYGPCCNMFKFRIEIEFND